MTAIIQMKKTETGIRKSPVDSPSEGLVTSCLNFQGPRYRVVGNIYKGSTWGLLYKFLTGLAVGTPQESF